MEQHPDSSSKSIVIVGPGAMGCLFAGLIFKGGYSACLLDKTPARARIINKAGVRIDLAKPIHVPVTTNLEHIGKAQVVIICVKAYDTATAVRQVLPAIGPETIVVSMQNGLGNTDAIKKSVPSKQLVFGITSHGATTIGIGRIAHAGTGHTHLAACHPTGRQKAVFVAGILNRSGIKTLVSSNATGMIWSKAIINSAINPLAAILNVPNGGLLLNSEARQTMRTAAKEAAAVARAKGIKLMYRDEVRAVESTCRATAQNLSSMLQDIRNHRRTELGAITGAIVREASRVGIDVPVSRMLLKRMLKIEAALI